MKPKNKTHMLKMLAKTGQNRTNAKKMLVVYSILAVLIILVVVFKGLFTPFILAFLLAYVLSPVVGYFESKNINRLLTTILIFLVLGAIGFIFVNIIINSIGDEVSAIQKKLPVLTEKINSSIDNLTTLFPSADKPILKKKIVPKLTGLTEITGEYLISTFSTIMSWFGGILGGITSIVVIVFVSFFLLKDWNKMSAALENNIPGKYGALFKKVTIAVNLQVGRYIRGQLLVALSVGTLATCGLLLFNFEYAFLLGAVAGITNLVPLLGPISAITVGLIVSVFSPQPYLISAIKVISVLAVVQMTDEVLISPLIIGTSVKIHPITVIMVIYFGGFFMGIIGMFIAIPVYVSLKALLSVLQSTLTRTNTFSSRTR